MTEKASCLRRWWLGWRSSLLQKNAIGNAALCLLCCFATDIGATVRERLGRAFKPAVSLAAQAKQREGACGSIHHVQSGVWEKIFPASAPNCGTRCHESSAACQQDRANRK